ncbi:MAG: DUF5989 family protein [Pyrinomonadaceae bacterium]
MSNTLSLLRELAQFLKQEKKWWLLPLCVILVLMTVLIVIAESSALAPFVYTLF